MTDADFPGLENLVNDFGAESKLMKRYACDIDWEGLLARLDQLWDAGMLFGELAIEGYAEATIGALIYSITPNMFTSTPTATELMWFVDSEYRDTTVGARLFKNYEKSAAANGAEHLSMVHLETSMPERLKTFYEKSGYEAVETHYFKLL